MKINERMEFIMYEEKTLEELAPNIVKLWATNI